MPPTYVKRQMASFFMLYSMYFEKGELVKSIYNVCHRRNDMLHVLLMYDTTSTVTFYLLLDASLSSPHRRVMHVQKKSGWKASSWKSHFKKLKTQEMTFCTSSYPNTTHTGRKDNIISCANT